MPKLSLRVTIALLFLVVFVAGPSIVAFYTDWLWFGEMGYQYVYATMLRGQGTLFLMSFVAAFLWLLLNLRVALTTVRDIRSVFTTRDGIEVALPGRRQLRSLATAVAAVVAMIAGDVAVVILENLSGLLRKHIPHRRPATVHVPSSFNLISRRRGTPGEILWKGHGTEASTSSIEFKGAPRNSLPRCMSSTPAIGRYQPIGERRQDRPMQNARQNSIVMDTGSSSRDAKHAA